MLYRGDDPIQDRSTKNRPVFGLGSSFGEPQALGILVIRFAVEIAGSDVQFAGTSRNLGTY